MRYYFKYDSGYINIDDNNMYLTNTGNWQETLSLSEKSHEVERQLQEKSNKKRNFFIGFYLILLYFIYEVSNTEKLLYSAVILGAGLYFLLNYFKRDFGVQYKVPLSKIKSVEILNDNGLKINFINANDSIDYEILKDVNIKGINFLCNFNTA